MEVFLVVKTILERWKLLPNLFKNVIQIKISVVFLINVYMYKNSQDHFQIMI